MIPNKAAQEVARQVLETGSEFFQRTMSEAVWKQKGLDSTFTNLLQQAGKSLETKWFENLLNTGVDNGAVVVDEVAATSTETLAAASIETATAGIIEGGGSVAGLGASRLSTLIEAGSRGLIIGLVIVGVEYAFDRVKKWRLDIAVGRAHVAMGATITAALVELFRRLNPKTKPWPQPWPKPQTQPQPEPDDERRKKRDSVKRYRRTQRSRK